MNNGNDKIVLSINTQHKKLVDAMAENKILFNGVSNGAIFQFGVALGLGNPIDLKGKEGYLRVEYLSGRDKAMLMTTKLVQAQSVNDIDKYCGSVDISYNEAERCANQGFEILKQKLEDANGDSELFTNRLLQDLEMLYQKNVK